MLKKIRHFELRVHACLESIENVKCSEILPKNYSKTGMSGLFPSAYELLIPVSG